MTEASPLYFLALGLSIALTIFLIMMWARFFLDLARTFARSWRPTGVLLVIAETVFTITDPPLKAVRRFIPPAKMGGITLDFAWSIVMIAVIILNAFVSGFVN
ncbi:MAG: YggT family protein [Rhodoglobus sp.]